MNSISSRMNICFGKSINNANLFIPLKYSEDTSKKALQSI